VLDLIIYEYLLTFMHTHSHSHNHAHHHGHVSSSSRLLLIGLLLTLGFALIEAIGGWWSGSLALLGDAGHMFSDSAALGIALVAARMMQRPPNERLSYGHGRIEVVAAITNSVLMLVIVIGIVREAFERFSSPGSINASAVMLIGGSGLVINIIVALVLSRDTHSLNTRAALLHVMGDVLGSIAAIVSGVVIYFWNWLPIDPIVSVFISALIVVSSVRLLREAIHIIMEGVPGHLDLQEVGEAMAAVDKRIRSVHDLHIWSLSSGQIALSAHIVLADMGDWQEILLTEQKMLAERFKIDHITLQPETPAPAVIVPLEELGRQNHGQAGS
jgi:cobalt-zinc-cadmium efflux system protein